MFCAECQITMIDVKRKGGFHGKTKYECPKCNKKIFKENKKNNRNKDK